jgi:cyclase
VLKKRVAATLIVSNGIVVQSINFKRYLPVGKPHIAIEFLSSWGIDEIILLDINASRNNLGPDFQLIKFSSIKCHVPLTIGGGITNVDQIRKLMQCGADKIALNQSSIHNTSLITEAAQVFGDQCVVVSIDAIRTPTGFQVYDYLKKQPIGIGPAEFAARAVDLGAGEILINSVDRDGSYLGFDTELINEVCSKVHVPVICSGGAKDAGDFKEVFESTNVSAASAANMFHFTEHSVNTTKSILRKSIDIRLETYADYDNVTFDRNCRLRKKSESELESLLFVRIEKEVI